MQRPHRPATAFTATRAKPAEAPNIPDPISDKTSEDDSRAFRIGSPAHLQ